MNKSRSFYDAVQFIIKRAFRAGEVSRRDIINAFDVSAATVNTVGLAAGLGDANGKLSEGEKVQARYLTIMEQTTKVTGDFKNTSDGLAITFQ